MGRRCLGNYSILGDSAAKLYEAFEALIECCPENKLDSLLQTYLQEQIDN